jgi:hypothetical protein
MKNMKRRNCFKHRHKMDDNIKKDINETKYEGVD